MNLAADDAGCYVVIHPDRILAVGNPTLKLPLQDTPENENEPKTDRVLEDYFAASETTVMVPVKIKYHFATNTVFSFQKPTTEDVEKALKSR